MFLVCLCKDYFGSLREAGITLVLELAARQSAILGFPAYFPSDGPHLQDILSSLILRLSDLISVYHAFHWTTVRYVNALLESL